MNPTYLKHPQHGAHIVYDHGALKRCLDTGWAISPEQPDGGLTESPFPPPAPKPAAQAPLEPAVRTVGVDIDGDGKIDKAFPERKKPGRPKKVK